MGWKWTILLSTQLVSVSRSIHGESDCSWCHRGKRRVQDLLGEDGRVAAITATAIGEALVNRAEDAIVAGVL